MNHNNVNEGRVNSVSTESTVAAYCDADLLRAAVCEWIHSTTAETLEPIELELMHISESTST